MIWFIPINNSSRLSEKEKNEIGDFIYAKHEKARLEHERLINAYNEDWRREVVKYMHPGYTYNPAGILSLYYIEPKWKRWRIRKIANLKLIKKYGWKQVFTDTV